MYVSVCVNIQWFVHRTFWRTRFALLHSSAAHDGFFSSVLFCVWLSRAVFVIGCQLATLFCCRIFCVDCDDAYSYGDNFIYLYSHYDLSMWCHNKAFNEFTFFRWIFRVYLDRCHDAPFFSLGLSMDFVISRLASECIFSALTHFIFLSLSLVSFLIW